MAVVLTDHAPGQRCRLRIDRRLAQIIVIEIHVQTAFFIQLPLNSHAKAYNAIKLKPDGAVFIVNTF